MGLPQLQTCCLIFDLKTGNIILGCLNAVLSFMMFVTMCVVASTVGTIEDAELLKPTSSEPFEEEMGVEEAAQLTGLYAMCIILVLMFLVKLVFDCFFIFGVIAERPSIIKAYFIMWIVFFLLSMFVFFLNVPKFNAWTIVSELFYIGFNVYVILLSHSYYRQLNAREDV